MQLHFYTVSVGRLRMAKSDSFFIRASVATDGTTYKQEPIDLGAYVDALGKTVLRVHNISVAYGTPLASISVTANSTNKVAFQVTTQSHTDMRPMSDRSVVSSGRLTIVGDAGSVPQIITDELDVAPQHWTNGYLIGVEQIYLATDAGSSTGIDQIDVVLECTVETLNQSAAMALALSQQ